MEMEIKKREGARDGGKDREGTGITQAGESRVMNSTLHREGTYVKEEAEG